MFIGCSAWPQVVANGRYGLTEDPESHVPFSRTYEFFWCDRDHAHVRRENTRPCRVGYRIAWNVGRIATTRARVWSIAED